MLLLQIYSCCLTQGSRTEFGEGACLFVIFEYWNHNGFQEPVKCFTNNVNIYVINLVPISVDLCICIILSLTFTNSAFFWGKKALTKVFINKSFISPFFRYICQTVYTLDITTLASLSSQWQELVLHILGILAFLFYICKNID